MGGSVVDIRGMQYFLAVADAGSITEAAAMLHITQPTISRQMQELEDELGTKLLIRGNRSTGLTEAGLVLRRRCEQILTSVDHTVEEVRAMRGDVSGVLSVGTIATAGSALLPPRIKRFREAFPKVTYQLWRAQALELFELFHRNVIEVAFLTKPFDERVFDSISLGVVALSVAMHPDLPLGQREGVVALHELDNVALIVPHRFRRKLEDAFAQHGLRLNILCDSKSISDDLLWVREGIAPAVTPVWSAGMPESGGALVYKTIADPELTVEYAMVWRRNMHLSQAAARFIEMETGTVQAKPPGEDVKSALP
jgi:DNA-binding transcriptional LysR family regulator